jgi:hypothetical protein
MFRKLFSLSALGIFSLSATAAPKATFGTNGSVNSIVRMDDKVFVSGTFRQVGPLVPYAGAFDGSSAKVNLGGARPDGVVRAVVPDGNGGWYIGGNFQKVGGAAHPMIAHILADGSVAPWNPNLGGAVTIPWNPGMALGAGGTGVMTMGIYGNKLYAGGNFTTAGSAVRKFMISFDLTSGAVTNFAPDADNLVRSMAFSRDKVYIGGEFTTLANGSVSRSRLAALDTSTGTATSWAPVADQPVYALAFCGPRIIAGGAFGTFNNTNTSRGRIAMLDTASGALSSWNPDIQGNQVNTIAVSGSKIYVGGYFNSVNSSTYQRRSLALLDTGSNLPLSWAPTMDYSNDVQSIRFANGKMYVAGYIADPASTSNAGSGIRIYDTVTLTQETWNPRISGEVYDVAAQGSTVYAAGDFLIVNTVDRAGLAAYYQRTGEVTPWNPSPNSLVSSLAASGNKIYAGGEFTSVNGNVTRNRLASFDTAAGTVTAWDPNINSSVRKILAYGKRIYVGGQFSTVNGSTQRNYAAAFDTSSDVATGWWPNPNGMVTDMAATGTQLFMSGGFSAMNTFTNRAYLAAVDTGNGGVTAWDPSAGGYVYTIYADGGRIYAAGFFSSVNRGGVNRQNAASFDTLTGTATAWNPAFSSPPLAFSRSGANMIAAGDFAVLNGGTMRRSIAQVDTVNGTATSWDANAQLNMSSVRISALLAADGGVYVGGDFTTLGSEPQAGFSALSVTTATPLSIRLESFTAARQGSVNQLSWKTTATAADRMQLEKSADGVSFSSFATLSGADATGSYTDLLPYTGVTYYRLRMFSGPGTYTFSQVVAVRSADVMTGSVTLAPVPATTQLTIRNTDAAMNGSAVQVLDIQGREITRFSLKAAQELDLSGWPSGSYFLKLANGTNLRFVKQ